MVYTWKTYGYKIPAEVVGKEFERITDSGGEVTADSVLEIAKSESSPIHDVFEWDDTVAADKYRHRQATQLILNLHTVQETEKEEEPLVLRAFVETTDKKVGSFMKIDQAFQNPETREMVLERALNELRAFERKYRDLKEFAELFRAIDKLVIQKEGRAVIATDVDHIQSHHGNAALFWDEANLQPLCHECHSRKTRAEDMHPVYEF